MEREWECMKAMYLPRAKREKPRPDVIQKPRHDVVSEVRPQVHQRSKVLQRCHSCGERHYPKVIQKCDHCGARNVLSDANADANEDDANEEAIIKALADPGMRDGFRVQRNQHGGVDIVAVRNHQRDERSDHPYSEENPKVALKTAIERRPLSLKGAAQKGAAEWEYVEAILDSGATVTVFPPSIGAAYELTQGEAAKAGVTYEVANGEEIPNLGERLMAVMTVEGTTRGLRAQVANVSKPLQAVRQLTKTGHMVVFGDGPEGELHYVVNKLTGEMNAIRDDGINYLMGLYIMPPEEAGFARPAAR